MRLRTLPFCWGTSLTGLVAGLVLAAAAASPQNWRAGEWSLQEGKGNAALDSSGHENHGRLHHTRWIQSEEGPCLQFTASDGSYVSISNSPSLNLAEAVRIDVWVKTYGRTGDWQGLVAKRDDSNKEEKSQYHLTLTPDLDLTYGNAFNNFWQPGSGFRLKPNQWYHVRADYDALLRQVDLYVDDRLVKTLPGAPVVQPSPNPVWLGWTGYGKEYLNGELRQVRISDLAAQSLGELRANGTRDPVLLKTDFQPHQYHGAGSGTVLGAVEAVVANPGDIARSVTLQTLLLNTTAHTTAELPAQSRTVVRCMVPEPAADTPGRIELLERDRRVASAPLMISGCAGISGFEAYVVSHTHSDFAWVDSLAGCLDKNVAAVAKSVELAEKYADFRFCMEHMLAVREFVRRYPEKLETLRRLMHEGRFEAGGFYTGPWELTSGGESLVRQLYFGKRWVETTLGVSPDTVWNVDVAGHTAQLPQILQKAGIKGLVISAGSAGPALLRWRGRDGSSVLTWRTLWGYGASADLGLRQNGLATAVSQVPRFLEDVRRNADEFHLPKLGFIADGSDIQSPTERVVQNIRRWNSEKRYPPLVYSSSAGLFAAVENASLPEAAGEMPSPWDTVQSQGNECFTPDRRLDGRLLAAEKFAALGSVAVTGYGYPRDELEQAWAKRLYTFDHNWGGWHGAENDRRKAEQVKEAARLTDSALQGALGAIASAIDFHRPAEQAIPVVIFNPLSWERHEAVTCELPRPRDSALRLKLVDGQGHTVPYQLPEPVPQSGPVRFVFSPQVPSLGYATYYATWAQEPPSAGSSFAIKENSFESPFYRLDLDPATGGIQRLFDKRTGRELVRSTGKYRCNELIALEDDDVDIGFHLTGKQWLGRQHPSTIRVAENGPVRLVVEIQGQLLEASTRDQQIILYADSPRIDLVTKLDWEGKRNVQLYQEFPLNVDEPTVRYAVPYGWEQYGQEMKYAAPWFEHEQPPVSKHLCRGVRGWVELANGPLSITLASQCNYAAFKDLSRAPEPGFLIQPLLLRTVRSCGDGGKLYYEQKGAQAFRFSLQAQVDPTHLGEELDSPLLSFVAAARASSSARLPDRLSFLSVSPGNVHVAVVKQAEDRQGLIVRLVEMKERSRSSQCRLQGFRPIQSATRTSIIEQGGQPASVTDGTVELTMAPAGIETVRLQLVPPAR